MNFLANSLYYDLVSTRNSIMSRLDTVEDIEGGLVEWSQGMEDDRISLLSRCGTLETDFNDLVSRVGANELAITALQSGKANVNHSHPWSDITGAPSIPAAQVPSDWNAASGVSRILNKPSLFSGNYNDLTNKPRKVFPFKAVVSSGNVVFHLTNDGTAGGTAFFASGPDLDSMQLTAEEGSTPHMFGTPVLSNSNKTLTIPVTKTGASFLSILSLNVLTATPIAANGSTIRLLIAGAS